MRRHVIIGNGGAAISAIGAIRSLAPEDEVVSISRERCPAYSPVLTVYYLTGHLPYLGMFICDDGFYRHHRVITRWGQAVTAVESGEQQVRLADGSAIHYDSLLIATGSTPIVPPIPGVNLPGVFTLWTADDARKLKEGLENAHRVAVIGAGMIGMQVINALADMGKQVAVIELLERPAALVLDGPASSIVERRLAQGPTKLFFGERVVEIAPEGSGKRLALASGREVRADAVVLSTGVRANVELVKESGVVTLHGILVDEACRTNVEGIYAAGDVAESHDPVTGQTQVQATWPNAIEQGRVAGASMAGVARHRLRRTRYNVFSVHGLACASLGVVEATGDGWQEQVTQAGERYRRLLFRDGRLAGAVLVGDVSEAGALLTVVEKQVAAGQATAYEGGWAALAQPFNISR